MVTTLFSLAREGKSNKKGVPNPLQMVVIATEFADVVQFLSPPPWIQRLLFGVLTPLGRLMGCQAISPRHRGLPVQTVPVEPLPNWVSSKSALDPPLARVERLLLTLINQHVPGRMAATGAFACRQPLGVVGGAGV